VGVGRIVGINDGVGVVLDICVGLDL
jgi:hypothetical protein